MEPFNREAWNPYILEGEKKHAVLLLHGFTGTAAAVRPLADALHGAGYTVYAPNLSGHGTTLENMRDSNWRDWRGDALDAFDELYRTARHVSVVGHSMGALLALLIAARRPVWQCVAIAPPLLGKRLGQYFRPLLAPFQETVPWGAAEQGYVPPDDFPLGYPAYPPSKLWDLNRLALMAYFALVHVHCPLLCVEPKRDRLVHPASAKFLLRRVPAARKKHVELPQSPHSCIWGPERNVLMNEVLTFLKD